MILFLLFLFIVLSISARQIWYVVIAVASFPLVFLIITLILLQKKLQQYNVKHFLLSIPWATHGCEYNLSGPAGQLSVYAMERFLKIVTGE